MYDLLSRVGDDPDIKIKMVIKPEEEVVFKRHFESARHGRRIKNELFVEIEAEFILYKNGDRIKINQIKLNI